MAGQTVMMMHDAWCIMHGTWCMVRGAHHGYIMVMVDDACFVLKMMLPLKISRVGTPVIHQAKLIDTWFQLKRGVEICYGLASTVRF